MRVLLLLLLTASTAGAVNPIPEPMSYAKPVAGGQFVLVQHGNAEAEQTEKRSGEAERARFRELRAQYPVPGLYRADDKSLVYPMPEGEFSALNHTFVSPDGVYLVRIEGDFWKTEAYTGGRIRPGDTRELAQIDGPAVSFWRSGSKFREYTVRDLVKNPDALPATPDHLLWYASGMMTPATRHFNVNTQESTRHTFDYTTGELLATTEVGLANPLTQKILIFIGILTALIFVGWLVFVLRPRRPVTP